MFCKHKWFILNETKVISEFGWEKTVFLLYCENCGKIKKVKIK